MQIIEWHTGIRNTFTIMKLSCIGSNVGVAVWTVMVRIHARVHAVWQTYARQTHAQTQDQCDDVSLRAGFGRDFGHDRRVARWTGYLCWIWTDCDHLDLEKKNADITNIILD